MCTFKFTPATAGEWHGHVSLEEAVCPGHEARLTAHLGRQAVFELSEGNGTPGADYDEESMPIHTFNDFYDPGGGGVHRAQFIARYDEELPHMWFPAFSVVEHAYASIIIATDAAESIVGSVVGNVSIRVGTLLFSAPHGYNAFGVTLPADMLNYVRLHLPGRKVGSDGPLPVVRGWIQSMGVVKAFPKIESLHYDPWPGIMMSGEVFSPRYSIDNPSVENFALYRARWVSDHHAVVAFSGFNTLVLGSIEIYSPLWRGGMDFKFCVKGGTRREVFFDILGPGDVDYMGLTFVAEVTHKYSGRAVCVGPSIPYVRKSGGLVWA